MDAVVSFDLASAPLRVIVRLPVSKSIINRLAIIYALSGRVGELECYAASSGDADVMLKALSRRSEVVDVGDSGTAMRFLMSYFSYVGRPVTLAGSRRLCQRPVADLAVALTTLGAEIEFPCDDGYPPVRIVKGLRRCGGEVDFGKGIPSSQYVSSLMLIAPMLDEGMRIILPDITPSYPYIDMTARLMCRCGADVSSDGRSVSVLHSSYCLPESPKVEADWSAASFWYEFAAMHRDVIIVLPDLAEQSLQGDAAVVSLFGALGVETRWIDGQCVLHASCVAANHLDLCLEDVPDLVLPFVVACLSTATTFEISGIKHLRIKESDRIASLIDGASQLGFVVKWSGQSGTLSWDGSQCKRPRIPVVDARGDHRVAMAFALASSTFGPLKIIGMDSVNKSYPGFMSDIKIAGFSTGIL